MNIYITGTSTVIVKQKQHVTGQLSVQLGYPNKSNFQGQHQGLCIKAKALTFKAKAKYHGMSLRTP